MLGTREYTLCSPFRANAYNSSFLWKQAPSQKAIFLHWRAGLLLGQTWYVYISEDRRTNIYLAMVFLRIAAHL